MSEDIAWYPNVDGRGSFGEPHVIFPAARLAEAALVTDVDSDGDLDVLTAVIPTFKSGRILWLENTNGKGRFGPPSVVSRSFHWPRALFIADLDGDGDDDLLSILGSRGVTVAWLPNLSRNGYFGAPRIISTTASPDATLSAGDLDNDGDVDVLVAHPGRVAWFRNSDGQGQFGREQIITTSHGAYGICPADLDGDHDLDLLVAATGRFFGLGRASIVWYENIDGRGTFGEEPKVRVDSYGAASLSVADFDNDGDLDVLWATALTGRLGSLVWYENTDSRGSLGPAKLISTTPRRAAAATSGDLDSDGDADILVFYHPQMGQGDLAWHENLY